jgi:hypothetical protein
MIAIGVTGHRELANLDAVSRAIDQVLAHILAVFGEDSLTLVSPLAEGADRLLVWRCLGKYAPRLVVPLPLALDDYRRDFHSADSRTAFHSLLADADEIIQLPPQPSREASYLAAGRYVLAHSDVLVAVWDGAPARGLGGTAQVVAESRAHSLPLAWIQAARPGQPGPSTRNPAPLPVVYERFPAVGKDSP